jgi:hypothetical protein
VGVPPIDTVVPLGTETVALAPGSVTEALPLGTETVALAAGVDTEALPVGTDTVAVAPGSDTEALPPGTDTDALPPGTLTAAVPPGADTVTGSDPVPRAGRPESPPLVWAPPPCEPPAVAGACCWDVVEPVLPALPGAAPAFLTP